MLKKDVSNLCTTFDMPQKGCILVGSYYKIYLLLVDCYMSFVGHIMLILLCCVFDFNIIGIILNNNLTTTGY